MKKVLPTKPPLRTQDPMSGSLLTPLALPVEHSHRAIRSMTKKSKRMCKLGFRFAQA